MSLDYDDVLDRIKVKISKMSVFQRRKLLNKFEKCCVTRGMGGMESVILWVAWVTYLGGRHARAVDVDCGDDMLGWVLCCRM